MRGYYGYSDTSYSRLVTLLERYVKSRRKLRCELGHDGCGCSNAPTMDGRAACALRVKLEIERRNPTFQALLQLYR
jgi:hypothetical protein